MSNDQQQFCRPIVLPDVPGEVTDCEGPIWAAIMAWGLPERYPQVANQGESAGSAVDDRILSALRTYATKAVRQDRMGRPLTSCDSAIATAAIKTLEGMGYTWNGGELWKPPLGAKADAPKADGWIEWGGGGKGPVPGDTMVHIKLRSGLDTSRPTYGEADPVKASTCRWHHQGRASDIVAYRVVKEKATPTGPTAGQIWFVGFTGEGDGPCNGGQVYRARIERLTDKVAELQVKRPFDPDGEIPQTYAYRRAAVEFIEKVEG